MRVEYDPEVGAAYIRLRDAPVAETEEIAPGVMMDLADDGRPTGFELLAAASLLGGPPHGVEFVLIGEPAGRSPSGR